MNSVILALFKFRAGHEVTTARADHFAALRFEPAGADRAELVGELGRGFGVGGLGSALIHDGVFLTRSVPQ